MRPLKLEIEGFTSFNDPTFLDMTDLDLFAITGPTGAGKSSLIDALCYALYGRVPRVGAEVASCIRVNHDRMRVTLEFAAGEDHLRVFRETRRKGAPNVRLDRWQNSDWQPVADRATEVNRLVEQTVGLDYEGFTRSVLLPQGQFQEFLAGAPEKRRSVLRSLLRLDVYERVAKRAGEIAREQKVRLDEREREITSLADATPESVARMEAELAKHQADAERLAAEATAVSAAVELSTAVDVARARERAATVEAEEALTNLTKAQQTLAAGDQKHAALQTELEALEAQLKANHFDAELEKALMVARIQAKDLESATTELAAAKSVSAQSTALMAEADANVERTSKALEAAVTALTSADAAKREAERHDLAAMLRHGLHKGDDCPVCGGKVAALTHDDNPQYDAAEQAYAVAAAAEAQARSAASMAERSHAQTHAKAEGATQRVVELTARRDALALALTEALPSQKDRSLAGISAALTLQLKAKTERAGIEASAKDIADQISRLAGQLGAAKELIATLEARVVASADAYAEAQAAVEAAEALLRDATTAWPDVASSPEATALLKRRLVETQVGHRQAHYASGQIEERLKRQREDVERAERLRKEHVDLKRDYSVAADLTQMLGAAKFQTWLQAEALQTLAHDGSRRLEALSGGRYRLDISEDGKDFEVIDRWNAEQARSVKTLSGGETFLASLALALALAESLPSLAASGRVVLDSIFLDEGFGSLDPEALNLAADALDALRTENRMVCVITHLQELAERLPARVTVTKTESGSSVAVA
jgi:exonuclease SbcC